MSWLHAFGTRARLLFGRTGADSRMDEEMRFHLEMEEGRLVGEGVDPTDARRRARVAFGGRDKYREEMRDGRSLAWLSGLRLDLMLGLRMLVKYPLLTMVGGVAIVVATAIGVGATEFIRDLVAPRLPLADGERIVRLFQVDSGTGGRFRRHCTTSGSGAIRCPWSATSAPTRSWSRAS